jgi:hypothetical protein
MRRCLDQHRLVSAPNPQISHHLKAAARGLLARHDDVASTGWLHLIREARAVPGRLFSTLDRAALAAALAIDPAAIADVALSIETPFQLRRRGVEARIVTGLERPSIDPVLCRAVAHALAWMHRVRAGTAIAAIAQSESVSERFFRTLCPAVAPNRRRDRAEPAAGCADHRAPGSHAPAIRLRRASPPARL